MDTRVAKGAEAPYGISPQSAANDEIPELGLRVRILMAEHGINSVTALKKRLAVIGIEISIAQLLRIVDGDAIMLNRKVLSGMLQIFQCRPADLFQLQAQH